MVARENPKVVIDLPFYSAGAEPLPWPGKLAVMEYGSERMPERPLMRPVADENEEALQELVRDYVAEELEKYSI